MSRNPRNNENGKFDKISPSILMKGNKTNKFGEIGDLMKFHRNDLDLRERAKGGGGGGGLPGKQRI